MVDLAFKKDSILPHTSCLYARDTFVICKAVIIDIKTETKL